MRPIFLTAALFLGWGGIQAQETFLATENSRRALVSWSSAAASSRARLLEEPTRYHWAAFEAVLDPAGRETLASLGVDILGFAGRPGPYQLYKVRVKGDAVQAFEALKGLPGFVNLLPILPEEKMGAEVFRGRFRRGILPQGKVKATVFFHRFHTRAEAEALLKGKVDEFLPDPDPLLFHVAASPAWVQALADLDEVARVEDFLERLPTNDMSRKLTKVSALQAPVLDTLSFPPTAAWNAGRAHTGDSIWICINEGVDHFHPDFRESSPTRSILRASHEDGWFSSPHGTHVAGIAAGNGWDSEANG